MVEVFYDSNCLSSDCLECLCTVYVDLFLTARLFHSLKYELNIVDTQKQQDNKSSADFFVGK